MQRPTGELESSHFGLAHRVEEELHIPRRSSQGGEKIIGNHRSACRLLSSDCDGNCHLLSWGIRRRFQDILLISGGHHTTNFGMKVLVAGFVANRSEERRVGKGGRGSGTV